MQTENKSSANGNGGGNGGNSGGNGAGPAKTSSAGESSNKLLLNGGVIAAEGALDLAQTGNMMGDDKPQQSLVPPKVKPIDMSNSQVATKTFRIYAVVGTIMVVAFLVWLRILWKSPNPDFDGLLKIGLRHRSRCYARDQSQARAPPYPYLTNVHSEMICGVGVCLYYNSLIFIGSVGFLFWVTT